MRGRDGRDERRVAQFRRMVALIERHESRRIERAVDDIEISSLQLQRASRACADFGSGNPASISSRTASPLRRLCNSVLDRFEEVGDFLFVDVELAVARDAEMPIAENLCAGKQIGEEMADQFGRENIILRERPRAAIG